MGDLNQALSPSRRFVGKPVDVWKPSGFAISCNCTTAYNSIFCFSDFLEGFFARWQPDQAWRSFNILSWITKGQLERVYWLVVSNIFYFHPYLGTWSNLTSIFFKWVGSTTKQFTVIFCGLVKKRLLSFTLPGRRKLRSMMPRRRQPGNLE